MKISRRKNGTIVKKNIVNKRRPRDDPRHEFELIPGDSGGQREPGMLWSMGSQRIGHNLVNEELREDPPIRLTQTGTLPQLL